MTDDAVMYLGDSNVVTASCDVMNLADGQVSSITFDHFEAASDTQFYGGSLGRSCNENDDRDCN